jgi:hypothetical protein
LITSHIGDRWVKEPLVLGHEAAGEIVQVGAGVPGWQVGDRVALEPGIPCRRCAYCKRGDYNLCQNGVYQSSPGADGFFAEYVTMPYDYIFRLPDNLDWVEGAMIEPWQVGLPMSPLTDLGNYYLLLFRHWLLLHNQVQKEERSRLQKKLAQQQGAMEESLRNLADVGRSSRARGDRWSENNPLWSACRRVGEAANIDILPLPPELQANPSPLQPLHTVCLPAIQGRKYAGNTRTPPPAASQGIRHLTPQAIRGARVMGRSYKLVCQAERLPDGSVAASVRPEQVPADDPLSGCEGATSIILFQMDVIHGLTLSEIHPDAVTTAYGPLADLITIARDERQRA